VKLSSTETSSISFPIVQGHVDQLPEGPLRERRQKAWQRYQELPMPSRKDEDWRFSNIKALDLDGYQYGRSVDDAPQVIDSSQPGFETSANAIFANQETLHFDPLPDALREQGVIWMPLLQAMEERPDLIEKYFLSQPIELGSEKFVRLHEALTTTGTVLYVPQGVEIELPFFACYNLAGLQASIFPHTLIVAGENSKVTLIDQFQSSTEELGFASSVNDIVAEPGAKVDYLCIQEWSEKTLSFQAGSVSVAKDAHTKCFHFNSGGQFARSEVLSRAVGSGARSEVLGLTLAHDDQEFDQRTLQNHEAPHTWSDLLFKNSLNHRSKTIFSGLIRVFEGAKQTDAYQTNRNLLLDPRSEGNSMPGLEIENDDVKCSHGATTSQIDAEDLFYMRARGIAPSQAKHLIALGFCEETLDRFGHPDLNPILRERIESKYRRSHHAVDGERDEEHTPLPTSMREMQGTV
jgi:Fe-S cluster assembly protein SufD